MPDHDQIEINFDLGTDVFKLEVSDLLTNAAFSDMTTEQMKTALQAMLGDAFYRQALTHATQQAAATTRQLVDNGLNWID